MLKGLYALVIVIEKWLLDNYDAKIVLRNQQQTMALCILGFWLFYKLCFCLVFYCPFSHFLCPSFLQICSKCVFKAHFKVTSSAHILLTVFEASTCRLSYMIMDLKQGISGETGTCLQIPELVSYLFC